jgi:hypothetical protein
MWVYTLCERREASARAATLVRQLLTADELKQLRVEGYLDVRSLSTPDRVYRVPGEPGLITVMDNGGGTMWLCAQPTRGLPPSEEVLVHKLLLEGAEEEYLRRANWFVQRHRARPGEGQVEVWTSRPPGVLRQR